jgi:hypothetical protein
VKAILSPIMWVAVTGFLACVLVHVCTLAGVRGPFAPWIHYLGIGVFVVWLPTVLVAARLAKGAKQSESWKAVLRGCPAWVKSGVYAVSGYAVLNFVLFIVQIEPYQKADVPDVVSNRLISGHLMVFYYVGAATLYSAIRLGDFSQRRCSYGHDVSPFAKYCDVCGVELLPPSRR